MRQYSADAVELTWLGLDFKKGLGTGTFIQEARATPSFTQKPAGAVSTVVRVHSSDRSGTVTIQVDMESLLHQQLKAVANRDTNPTTRGQNTVGDMVLVDSSNGEQYTWVNAYIQSIPDRSRGVEAGVAPWVFLFEDFRDTEVEDLLNVVGG